MNNDIFIVYAINEDGLILLEAFDSVKDALTFEKDHVVNKIRTEYGDKAADSENLMIGFSQRILHTS